MTIKDTGLFGEQPCVTEWPAAIAEKYRGKSRLGGGSATATITINIDGKANNINDVSQAVNDVIIPTLSPK